MSYYGLTEKEYTKFKDEIIEGQYLDGPHFALGNFIQSPTKFVFKWNEVTKMEDDEIWYDLDTPGPRNASVLFKETEVRFFGMGRTIQYARTKLEASKTSGASLFDQTARQVLKRLDKYLEAFTWLGPIISTGTTRLGTTSPAYGTGLWTKANNTSTYTTVKFAATLGPYKAVLDMKNQLMTDSFGFGKCDFMTDTTMFPYLFYHASTTTLVTEYEEIKNKLLNGGSIYLTDQLGSAGSNDGRGLLVDRAEVFWNTISADGPGWEVKGGPPIHNKLTDSYVMLIAGGFGQAVYQTNAICKHDSMDLA